MQRPVQRPAAEQSSNPTEHQWAQNFKSWSLVAAALLRVGKQAAVLVFLFYQTCSFNSTHHLILGSCRREILGLWVYPCEATKAMTRSFPLFAASLAMIVTGRYILHHRIFYQLLMKKVLLDFTNYDIKKDLVIMVMFLGFLGSLLHFALESFFPPYLTLDKLTTIATMYLLPCIIFFLLMREASDVEWSMLPLPKFVESDPPWAKRHIAQCQNLTDNNVRRHILPSVRKLYHAKADHMFEVDELLDEIIRASQRSVSGLTDDEDFADEGLHGFYKGMWPGRIFLNPHLRPTRFRKAFMTFTAMVLMFQFCIVVALATCAIQEGFDAVPGGISNEAFYVGGVAFESVDVQGYCRDEDLRRPPGYFRTIESMTSRHHGTKASLVMQSHSLMLRGRVEGDQEEQGRSLCAHHCAERYKCIGLAMDRDFCTIYLIDESTTPTGWTTLTDHIEKASQYKQWTIIKTDQSLKTECFVKLEIEEQPEKFVASLVYLVHIFGIVGVVSFSGFRTYYNYFVPVA